jgi:hypothetical protein
MAISIDYGNQIIGITSPTTAVDGQTLHDFVEDNMATPEGLLYDDILKPEGKIEDPTNPGTYSQIILVLNSPWQIQFWQGSGYTRVYGAKIVGGLNDQPLKATGAAGDISVLESPVDGLTIAVGGIGTPQEVADAVWEADHADYTTPGTFGFDFRTMLGLQQHNFRLKDQVYQQVNLGNNNFKWVLTSGTIRVYESASDADNDTNHFAEYSIVATYDSNGNCTSYKSTLV